MVVTVALPDAYAILPFIHLFSRNRRVEQMFSSSKNSQWKKCWKFGHISNRCPSSLPVCPFCSLTQTKPEHRCSNPSCPKGGNLQLILACCPSLVACCPNCQDEYSARSRDCPSSPKATTDAPKVLSRQTQDSMDLAEDQAGPLTVVRLVPGAPPHTPSAPGLPAMLLHRGKGPTAPSPISSQEKVVMNPLTLTALRTLPNNGECFHSIH